MLISLVTQWFARQFSRDIPATAPRLSRLHSQPAPLPAAPVAVSQSADAKVIQIKGEARADSAGALLNGLLSPAARRSPIVILDLSELRSISCLALGVLRNYCRGVVRNGGRVRLGQYLQPEVKEALKQADLVDLFEPAAEARDPPNHRDIFPSVKQFRNG
jgi:anti-anti-sigma factor